MTISHVRRVRILGVLGVVVVLAGAATIVYALAVMNMDVRTFGIGMVVFSAGGSMLGNAYRESKKNRSLN